MRTRIAQDMLLPLHRALAICVTLFAATGAALAQQSAQTAAAIGVQGASQASVATDFQDQALARHVLEGGAPAGAAAEFPAGRLRETWHGSYDSLLPNHGPSYETSTVEGSAIGSVLFKFPQSILGGNVQTAAFAGENWIGTSYRYPSSPAAILPGTSSMNRAALGGGYVLYSSGSSYAMNTVTIFEGATKQWGGGVIPGSASYDTHGFVNTSVAGHVFDLDRTTRPLKLDVRGGLLYSYARGDTFSDPSGQILSPSTQEWTASLSAMLFRELTLSRGEIVRPYFKAGLREQLSYSNKIGYSYLGAVDTYRFGQSGTLGAAEVGFDYSFSNVTLTGAVFGERAADQGTVGGRLGAKFALDGAGR